MLEPRRLEILREVAARGSISRAAQALHLTQPAVSRQVAALERETGATLLERRARGVSLTDAGRLLVGHAESIAGHLRTAQNDLDALLELRAGRVRVGTFPSAGATILLDAVTTFHRRHPDVELAVSEVLKEPALARLRAGELELALVFDADPAEGLRAGVEWIRLMTEEMHVGLPRGHALAGRDELELADLRDEPWLQGTQGGRHGLVYRACVSAGFEPRITCEVDDPLMIGGLVAAGVGLTLVSRLATERPRPGVVTVRLRNPPTRTVFAALLPSARRAPATDALLELLRAAARRRDETPAARAT